MYPPSKLHQLHYMREPASVDTGAFKTPMKPTSNLHVSSMEPPSNLHQSDCMREPARVDTGAFKISMKPTSNLHVSSMEPPSKLHQKCSKGSDANGCQIDRKSIVI